jgi:hypothetical protein
MPLSCEILLNLFLNVFRILLLDGTDIIKLVATKMILKNVGVQTFGTAPLHNYFPERGMLCCVAEIVDRKADGTRQEI